jgi:hypothetical protein
VLGQGEANTLAHEITVHWPDAPNEGGAPMLWLGAWLVGDQGVEGDWFHSGRGGAETAHPVPSEATGVRLRRWPNEGLAPEYADLIPAPTDPIEAADQLFEREQPFSLLPAHAD